MNRRSPAGGGVVAAAVLAALAGSAAADRTGDALPPQRVIADAARAVVKVYGAGGLRGLEGYQSGILVSPPGRIATVMSTVLDCDEIVCVLDDGTRHRAALVGADPRREVALLEIDAADLPAFTLTEAPVAAIGTRVLALSNAFGVAVGDERVGAQRGVIAARVPLDVRRGALESTLGGDVFLLDCTTNNPGSPGGAVVDSRGRLVGMLGKELRSTATGVWLNYALPAAELADACDDILNGEAAAPSPAAAALDPEALGIVLVPELVDRTPPFVEAVRPGSAAASAGVRADDLVVAVAGRSTTSREAVARALGGLAPGDPVRLSVVRHGMLVDVDLGPRPPAPAGAEKP